MRIITNYMLKNIRIIKKMFLLSPILFFPNPVSAQSKTAQLANVMKTYHNFHMFDGSVLVAEHGKVVYKGAFGLANREWNIPNTVDTKFMIGSVSKSLTAALMLIQVQKGLIDLEQTLDTYLPEFKGRPAGKVNIKQLLSHTSGMPNYDIIKDFFPRISRQYYSREDYIKIFADSALSFKPGTHYYYSSWGYFTLGYIMEKVTGKTYAQLMKADIFDKIGMHNSGSYEHMQIVSRRATGYDYNLGAYTSADFRDQSNTMGTGDLYSTVEDLFKFHLAISNHTLLNKHLTDKMLTTGVKPASYGYGWFNKPFKYTPVDSVNSNFHLGMTEGFLSFLVRIPSANSFIVILSNSSPTDFFGITGDLAKVLYHKPVHIKQPLHRVVETEIAKRNAASAVEIFRKLKADTAHYSVDWISMNFIAEQLLSSKRLNDARILSESNAVSFPDHDLVMLTLGNVYLALNRKVDAIAYFKKALVIYPDNAEARNKLKELSAN